MKILVRLPNWLGDMVMSSAVLEQLRIWYPGATISVIVKKGLEDLLHFFPLIERRYIFDKKTAPGLKGVWRFGKEIGEDEKYDVFITLPDSPSSAVMGFATRSTERIGYKKEGRQFLLTHSYKKPEGLHRVAQYVKLVEYYSLQQASALRVQLQHGINRQQHVVVNINSEASSRRLTVEKATELIATLRSRISRPIVLIGASKEMEFVNTVLYALPVKDGIESVAGKTNLGELAAILASAYCMLSTDSGPGHLANALGTPVLSLFGAGNENITRPYEQNGSRIIRLGELNCEPCEKNVCRLYPTPLCLDKLNTNYIIDELNDMAG